MSLRQASAHYRGERAERHCSCHTIQDNKVGYDHLALQNQKWILPLMTPFKGFLKALGHSFNSRPVFFRMQRMQNLFRYHAVSDPAKQFLSK
jgi:hypothetical protein